MPLEVPHRDEWFPTLDDLPQPDWPAINEWLRENVAPAQVHEAIDLIITDWLTRLALALGSQFAISSGKYYTVLSDLPEEQQRRMGDFLDETCGKILQRLGKAPPLAPARKWVIIRLPDMDTNFRVMPTLDGGGETVESAAEFFWPGAYPEIYCAEEVSDAEFASLVRSQAYHILGHLPLPVWLRVAFTVLLDADLTGEATPEVGSAVMAEHRTRWNERSIQEFWSGRFSREPLWQDLFTSLALALLKIINGQSSSDPEGLQLFIGEANAKDGGEAAARHVFGKGLAAFVTAFLGPGDWAPKPATWQQPEEDAEDEA